MIGEKVIYYLLYNYCIQLYLNAIVQLVERSTLNNIHKKNFVNIKCQQLRDFSVTFVILESGPEKRSG